MSVEWQFDKAGPEWATLRGPVPLATRGMGLPPKPGFYVVTCGDCLAHAGTSGTLASRVGMLARLSTHRGSAEVLCGAFCSGRPPAVWWEELPDTGTARIRETEFKRHYGEPPHPREKYQECVNGARLRRELIAAVGEETWEAGFAEAVFLIGEKMSLLFGPRFNDAWARIGKPPGPWSALL